MSSKPLRQKVRNIFSKRKGAEAQQYQPPPADGNAVAGAVSAFTGAPTPHTQNPYYGDGDGEVLGPSRNAQHVAQVERHGEDEDEDEDDQTEESDEPRQTIQPKVSHQPEAVHQPETIDTAEEPRRLEVSNHASGGGSGVESGLHDTTGIEHSIGKLKLDDAPAEQPSQPRTVGGVAVFNNAKSTTVHREYAPAVTHETVRHDVHEIREERIQREIHEHHVVTHVLPVVDKEVLPPRHFIRDEDGVEREVSEAEALEWEKRQGRAQTSVNMVTTRHNVEKLSTT